jgi:hypothetical protein
MDGLIGLANVPGVTIGVGVDRHRGYVHLATRSNDTDGYLPAVGDQNFHKLLIVLRLSVVRGSWFVARYSKAPAAAKTLP